MKQRNLFIRALLFACTLPLLLSCSSNTYASRRLSSDQLCIQQTCMDVEFAITVEERVQGLMFRKSMKASEGMLLVFEESGKHSIWMKNVNFYLDLLWIDEDRKIVHIQKEAPPCVNNPCAQYNPPVESLYVLELLGGSVDRYHFKIGQSLNWS